jgi:tellurite resistance protein TehA-like permease
MGTASVLIFVAMVWGTLWLASNYPAEIEAIRDVFIILFATAACSSVVVLVMLLMAVIRLINMLEFEIKPILEKTNETISLVQGTTSFVSTNVVKPTITMQSYWAGAKRGLQVLFGDPRRNWTE